MKTLPLGSKTLMEPSSAFHTTKDGTVLGALRTKITIILALDVIVEAGRGKVRSMEIMIIMRGDGLGSQTMGNLKEETTLALRSNWKVSVSIYVLHNE